jgi:transcription elongation factor Elf1
MEVFFVWVVILAILAGIGIQFLQDGMKRYKKNWNDRPSLDEYKRKNPNCVLENSIQCNCCGSSNIASIGLNTEMDIHRAFICNHCGAQLYRTNLEMK